MNNLLQKVKRKIGVVFVVNSHKIYIDVADVRRRFTAQEIARKNTGKLVVSRSVKNQTVILVNHKCTCMR